MFRPTLDEVMELSKGYHRIPVSMEIFADSKTPIEVLRNLRKVSRNCYILESMENQESWGRYTFLGYNPTMEVVCTNNVMKVRSLDANNTNAVENEVVEESSQEISHPGIFLKELMKAFTSPKFSYLPTFTGGLVGYFSYDYIKYSEPILKLDAKDEEGFKDVDLMLFEKVIAFDHLKQKMILIANMKTDEPEKGYDMAKEELLSMMEIIKRNPKDSGEEKGELKSEFRLLFEKEQYYQMVEKAKKYIYEGDIFQVVLSNRMEADFEGSLFNAYRILRTTNPSPYMFYFSSKDMEIAGASPETLVKLENGVLHTFPLAGTRPRGKTEEEDLMLEKELLADPKELAEHNMLVDLGRNDLGKISKFGTVEVEKYMSIERYSHVMHIGSTVRGEIRDDMDSFNAIDAVLPAGTLSGAPKIRACEIINELENNKRGVYGGAIGYVDFTGNMDTCIAIRLAYKKNNKVFVRSGAGIVADSVPEKEFQECVNKAQAVVNALQLSQEVEA